MSCVDAASLEVVQRFRLLVGSFETVGVEKYLVELLDFPCAENTLV